MSERNIKMLNYFFVLEKPLPIETYNMFNSSRDEVFSEIAGLVEIILPGNVRIPNSTGTNFYNLQIFHVDENRSSWESFTDHLNTKVSSNIFYKSKKELSQIVEKHSKKKGVVTIISLTTLVDCNETIEKHARYELKAAIEFLEDFIIATRMVISYPSVTKETIHPLVFWASSDARKHYQEENGWIELPNTKTPKSLAALNESKQQLILDSLVRYRANDPLMTYLEYRNKGSEALENGEYSLACTNFGIAAEVLFSALLNIALWEEVKGGLIKEDLARKIIDSNNLAPKVKNEFHPRFGGNWRDKIQAWEDDVASPRHRVVHTGTKQDKATANRSRKTLGEFEQFVFNTVHKNLKKYPLLCFIFAVEGLMTEHQISKTKSRLKDVIPGVGVDDQVSLIEQYREWIAG